jgi:hypothetical protein
MTIAATVLAVLLGGGIIWVGVRYLLAPQASASTFGMRGWPAETDNGWLNVKGVRDVVSGIVILVPLALGQTQLVGLILLASALTPFGDAVIVLRSGGSKALAYGMHAGTGVAALVAGALFLASAGTP